MKRRTVARMFAVQALFATAVGAKSGSEAIEDFKSWWASPAGGFEGFKAREFDHELFFLIVSGTTANLQDIDKRIVDKLFGSKQLKDLDITLLSIVRAATFELIYNDEVDYKVVIDEYMTIAKNFYIESSLLGFVNGLLDGIRSAYKKPLNVS